MFKYQLILTALFLFNFTIQADIPENLRSDEIVFNKGGECIKEQLRGKIEDRYYATDDPEDDNHYKLNLLGWLLGGKKRTVFKKEIGRAHV